MISKIGMQKKSSKREKLVEKIKREISEKTYNVKSKEIADKMAQKLREEENKTDRLRKKPWSS